jgi:hypothetical protein
MTIQTIPLTLPPSADPSRFIDFGREIIGVNPANLSTSDFAEIQQLLYKVRIFPRGYSGLEHSLIFSSSSTTPSFSETQISPPSSNMRSQKLLTSHACTWSPIT